MTTKAAIVGWAHSPFGKLDAPDIESLFSLVGTAALDHAGVAPGDVELAAVGVLNSGFSKQGFEAGLVSTAVPGLEHVPAIRTENACATGSAALYTALDFIESGRGRIALVVGAEKMTATSNQQVGEVLLCASYRKEEEQVDGGFAGIFGRIAAHYFQRYGDRSAELAMIAAKNHANGTANPRGPCAQGSRLRLLQHGLGQKSARGRRSVAAHGLLTRLGWRGCDRPGRPGDRPDPAARHRIQGAGAA